MPTLYSVSLATPRTPPHALTSLPSLLAVFLLLLINFFLFFNLFISFYCYFFLATIVTGPLLPKPAKPLPADLETFMASAAGDDGVIVVAFGSMLSVLPTPTLDMLTKVLGGMKYKVLWKLKGLLNPFLIQN